MTNDEREFYNNFNTMIQMLEKLVQDHAPEKVTLEKFVCSDSQIPKIKKIIQESKSFLQERQPDLCSSLKSFYPNWV